MDFQIRSNLRRLRLSVARVLLYQGLEWVDLTGFEIGGACLFSRPMSVEL